MPVESRRNDKKVRNVIAAMRGEDEIAIWFDVDSFIITPKQAIEMARALLVAAVK